MTENASELLDLSTGELPLIPGMPAWCSVAQPGHMRGAHRTAAHHPTLSPFLHQVCRGWRPLAAWHVLLQHGMDLPVLDLRGESRDVRVPPGRHVSAAARAFTWLRSSPSHTCIAYGSGGPGHLCRGRCKRTAKATHHVASRVCVPLPALWHI